MKVIIDNKIPFINGIIEGLGEKTPKEVIYVPGMKFTPEIVRDADALIIRTRTHCNRELLEGSKVRFIATATIGFDHIDTDYCREAGISWTNAPGCNSGSVEQYIHSTLLLLEKVKGFVLKDKCIGVIGIGNVGSKVCRVAQELGMRVLKNDPPRADKEGKEGFTDLETIARECDVITFHTPLNKEGKYKTYHLADRYFFDSLKKRPVVINTSRGEVIENNALLSALNNQLINEAVIDVWENEPDINLDLLNKVFIGTPHIAGYSADGKANATRMSLESFCRFFEISPNFEINPPVPEITEIIAPTEADAYLQTYDPRKDSEALKRHPELFEQLRGDYPLRRERNAFTFRIG